MKVWYYLGRLLQLSALIILPSSIWVGQFMHSEQGSISIFAGSVIIFYLGWLLTRTQH